MFLEAVSIAVPATEQEKTKTPRRFGSREARLDSFARELDALRREVEAELGTEDARYIERVIGVSRALEVAGRGLIYFSFDPITFVLGTSALSLHKILELMEIGHTVMHGTYDAVPGAEHRNADSFRWKAPIDERSWHDLHNLRHHQYTNIAGRDPDLDFGGLRLSRFITHRAIHRLQPLSNFATWLSFAAAINVHATGVLDWYTGKQDASMLKSRSWRSVRAAHAKALRKFVPYYAREFILFPLLAGPFFWKIVLANASSEVARDVCAGAIIYCGHVGARELPAGTRTRGRAAWYALQAETAFNVEVPRLVSILCGGLDLQIEHHLFPKLPPNRLRQIAPRVRALCAAHGIEYRSAPWPARLREVTRALFALRREPATALE